MPVRLLTTEHARVVVPSDESVAAANDAEALEVYMLTGDASGLEIPVDADWFEIRPLTDSEVARAEAYADMHAKATAAGQRAWAQVITAAARAYEGDGDAEAKMDAARELMEAAESDLTDEERRLRAEHQRWVGFAMREKGRLGYVSGPVDADDFMRLPGRAREELGRHVVRLSQLPKARAQSSGSPSDTPTTKAETAGGAETAPEAGTRG